MIFGWVLVVILGVWIAYMLVVNLIGKKDTRLDDANQIINSLNIELFRNSGYIQELNAEINRLNALLGVKNATIETLEQRISEDA